MNKYRIHLQSNDQRLFEVVIKADEVSDDGYLVKFWRKAGPFSLFRRVVHYVSADALVSVICEGKA